MDLDQIEMTGLEPLQALIDLLPGDQPGVGVDLGHQEDLLAVAVAQCLAHQHLGVAARVVPAIVHEGDAIVDRGADDLNRLRALRPSDVRPADPDRAHALARSSQRPVFHRSPPFRRSRARVGPRPRV